MEKEKGDIKLEQKTQEKGKDTRQKSADTQQIEKEVGEELTHVKVFCKNIVGEDHRAAVSQQALIKGETRKNWKGQKMTECKAQSLQSS